MKMTTQRIRTIDLGYEQMLLFDNGPGSRVRVLYGCAWLTQPGESGDTVLRAGQEHGLRGQGPALIEGLEPSRVQILDFGKAGWLHRAWAGLSRGFGSLRLRSQLGPQSQCATCN